MERVLNDGNAFSGYLDKNTPKSYGHPTLQGMAQELAALAGEMRTVLIPPCSMGQYCGLCFDGQP